MEGKLKAEVDNWLICDKNSVTRGEIKALVAAENFKALQDCLMRRMEFGTAGLRAKMAAGNAYMNDLTILQTTQGIAKYLLKSFGDEACSKGVVVGYDARHNSSRFANRVACMLISYGIKVYKYSSITPTPFVPYGVCMVGACLGIMVTASHNPKQDNGYKVYLANGAQINPPHDKLIADAIESDLTISDQAWDESVLDRSDLLNDPLKEAHEKYFADLSKLCKYRELNSKSPLRFVYTPVHGVGHHFARESFNRFSLPDFYPVAEQMNPDPEFSTVQYPNPEEGKGVLKLSFERAEAEKCTIVLANDPDADRLAVAEKNEEDGSWKVFTGNELGALFGWWALHLYKQEQAGEGKEVDKKNVWFISSTVSSKILKAMADQEGISFEDTLTGFKWMGNRSHDHMQQGGRVLFAFEEAIGFMFGTNVLDKDGISAMSVMAEMATYLRSIHHKTLARQLQDIYLQYGHHVSNNSYYICREPAKIRQMFVRLRNYGAGGHSNGDHSYPAKCGTFTIDHVRDVTTGFDSRCSDKKSTLPVTPSSEMITFYFSNGATVTLRTSGTEPKVKYYSEICGKRNVDELKAELDQLIQELVDHFYQPDKNGFESRTTS